MKAIMGHMSRAMLERYSHIRKATKVEAIQAVDSRSAFSTQHVKESPEVGHSAAPKAAVTHSKGA
jgi:hypothetical protein